jgi:chorismate mutase
MKVMNDNSNLIVVSASVLPEIFSKILEVKSLIAKKEEKSYASACKKIGISRSAYYKYKDYVFAYDEKITQKIITFYFALKDKPGILFNVLKLIYALDANVLTINQNIPIDGVASVTISLKLNGNIDEAIKIKAGISELDGVVEVKLLTGE